MFINYYYLLLDNISNHQFNHHEKRKVFLYHGATPHTHQNSGRYPLYVFVLSESVRFHNNSACVYTISYRVTVLNRCIYMLYINSFIIRMFLYFCSLIETTSSRTICSITLIYTFWSNPFLVELLQNFEKIEWLSVFSFFHTFHLYVNCVNRPILNLSMH